MAASILRVWPTHVYTRSRSHPLDKETEIRFLTDADSPFEEEQGLVLVALAEGQQTDAI